jgi:Ca-activated chloride channel family protein
MALHTAASPRRTRLSRFARALPFFLLSLTLPAHLAARDAAAQDEPPASSDEVVRIDTDLVAVPVYVTDARGRRVAGLGAEDFELREEGRRVGITHFAAGAERVALLFLLDASGSTREIITQQRETALALFSRFGPGSRLAVMQFRERPELTQPFTTDLRLARRAFRIESLPDRRTAIFDAARAAVEALRGGAAHPAERRIVVLISDGLDTASATAAPSVIDEARRAGVSFYVIHLPLYAPRDGRLAARPPSKSFRELATRTGGQFFVVGDARSSLDPRAEHDLRPVFRAIAEDLAGQYVLGYHAGEAAPANGPRRLEARLASPRTRRLRLRQLRETYEVKARP